jgi:hypothetical protein
MNLDDDTNNSSDDTQSDQSTSGDDSTSEQSASTDSGSGGTSSDQDSSIIQLPPDTDITAPDLPAQADAAAPSPTSDSPAVGNPEYTGPDSGQADDSTAHVDYDPNNPPTPILRAPDGSEGPWPPESERPEEVHTLDDETTTRISQGGDGTDAGPAPEGAP